MPLDAAQVAESVAQVFRNMQLPCAGNFCCPIYERKASVVPIQECHEWPTAWFFPIAIKGVAVLAMRIKLLVPNVREVMLIQLQHSEQGKAITDGSLPNFESA